MPHGSSLRETLRFIRSQRALIHVIAGATIATFSGMGLIWWTPAFLSRSHGFSVGEAGYQVGMMSVIVGAAALVAATLITFRLARMAPKGHCHFLAWFTLPLTLPGVWSLFVTAPHRGLSLLQ